MGGQVVLGYLADRLGRRRLLLVSGGLTFAGALGSACAFDFGPHNVGLWSVLIAWRFVMGVGIGGEYPLSASHTAEHAAQGESGVRLALVFVLFGVGPILAAFVVYVCQVAGASHGFTWRFAFGVGAALSVLSVSLRYRLVQNSPKFEQARRERALWAAAARKGAQHLPDAPREEGPESEAGGPAPKKRRQARAGPAHPPGCREAPGVARH